MSVYDRKKKESSKDSAAPAVSARPAAKSAALQSNEARDVLQLKAAKPGSPADQPLPQPKQGADGRMYLPWYVLPPGHSKNSTTITTPDGRKMSQRDYIVETWKKKLKSGSVTPQSRWQICDWVQDPVTKKWKSSWDSVRQRGTNSPAAQQYAKERGELGSKKVKKGPNLIHPDEAKGEGKKIPQAKVFRMMGLGISHFVKTLPQHVPAVGTTDYQTFLIDVMMSVEVEKKVRHCIYQMLHVFQSHGYIDMATWDESKYSVLFNAYSALCGTVSYADLGKALVFRHLFLQYNPKVPKLIAKLSAKHPELAKLPTDDHEMTALVLASKNSGASLSVKIANGYFLRRKRWNIVLTKSRKWTNKKIDAAARILHPHV